MKIQILGTGCAKCRTLAQLADDVAQKLGLTYELEKVTDIAQISAFGVMATPALALDGTVKIVGKVPSVDEMEKILSDATGN